MLMKYCYAYFSFVSRLTQRNYFWSINN